MEHIIDQADPEYTYCDKESLSVEVAVSLEYMDRANACTDCLRAFDTRY